jgi:hypothetical protein
MDKPTNGIDILKEEINQRREGAIKGLNAEKAAEIEAVDTKLADDKSVLDERIADAEKEAQKAHAEASRSAAIAWPDDEHVTVQYKGDFWKHFGYIVALVAVGGMEIGLNKVAFEYLRMSRQETFMSALGLGFIVMVICHFTGLLFQRASASPKNRTVNISLGVLFIGIAVAALWYVADIRLRYMAAVGLDPVEQMSYVVLAAIGLLAGIILAFMHAPNAADKKAYGAYKGYMKKHHKLEKKIEKLKSTKADLSDEASRKKEKIANKYKGLIAKKNQELDSELQKLTREHHKQQMAIEKANADEELAAKKQRRLQEKIKGATGSMVVLLVSSLSLGMLPGCSDPIQPSHELVVLIDQTETYDDRTHVMDAERLSDFFVAEKDYSGSISFGYLTGRTAKIQQKIERPPYAPGSTNLAIMDERKAFDADLKAFNLENMLKPVGKEASQSSLYQPMCAVLTKLAASSADKKTLVMVSDMIENSTNASFYKEAEKIESNPEGYPKELAARIAAKSCEFPKGSGIEVVILYTPKEDKDDKYYNASMKVWEEIFKEAGITCRVLPDL